MAIELTRESRAEGIKSERERERERKGSGGEGQKDGPEKEDGVGGCAFKWMNQRRQVHTQKNLPKGARSVKGRFEREE
jgi:hypothetical protein